MYNKRHPCKKLSSEAQCIQFTTKYLWINRIEGLWQIKEKPSYIFFSIYLTYSTKSAATSSVDLPGSSLQLYYAFQIHIHFIIYESLIILITRGIEIGDQPSPNNKVIFLLIVSVILINYQWLLNKEQINGNILCFMLSVILLIRSESANKFEIGFWEKVKLSAL